MVNNGLDTQALDLLWNMCHSRTELGSASNKRGQLYIKRPDEAFLLPVDCKN